MMCVDAAPAPSLDAAVGDPVEVWVDGRPHGLTVAQIDPFRRRGWLRFTATADGQPTAISGGVCACGDESEPGMAVDLVTWRAWTYCPACRRGR